MHYQRVKKTGVPERTPVTVEDRFWSKVDKGGPDECWVWTATLSRGYGWFYLGDEQGDRVSKGMGAHRWLYLRTIGPIPEGLDLDHLCRNPPCVNPSHMEPVTRKENLARGTVGMGGRRNAAKTHCPAGHPYEGNNLRVSAGGARSCRACAREWMRRRRATAKQAC